MTEMSLQGIRILLLDDHPAVREGLSLLLAKYGIVICGEAACREEALRILSASSPDLVLVDLSLGDENGLDLIEELQVSGIKTLVYTMHDDARHIKAALAAGALGYVTKREMTATLREAICTILSGQRYLSSVAAEVLQAQGEPEEEDRLLMERLSARELEIFQLVGEGYATADIAVELQISLSTIETHFARIIGKFGFSGTKEMRRRAIRHRNSAKQKG